MGKMKYDTDLSPLQRLKAGIISIFAMFTVILAALWALAVAIQYIDSFWIAFFFFLLFVGERYVDFWNKYSPWSADNNTVEVSETTLSLLLAMTYVTIDNKSKTGEDPRDTMDKLHVREAVNEANRILDGYTFDEYVEANEKHLKVNDND